MSETATPTATQAPTVYFIDDSATMREVIKIAFRREHLQVVTCHDAATALAQMEEHSPDVVISDVIMPDKDGYEVCEFIKQHPRLSQTPVILMSGVVNRTVAEKAIAVKADELIRKPFQPQELIARVKQLLNPPGAAPSLEAPAASATQALSDLFASRATPPQPVPRPAAPASPVAVQAPPPVPSPARAPAPAATVPRRAVRPDGGPALDVHRLRAEIARLEMLVRKLQAELEAERQYSRALEEHVKTLQDAD